MSRRYSRNASERDREAPSSRPSSSKVVTNELLKTISQRFDCEIIFKINLSLRGLTRISGFENCVNLVDLNLSGNSITKIEGLDTLSELRRLSLSCNQLNSLDSLPVLNKLETLSLQDNYLSTINGLCLTRLSGITSLRALYFQNLDRSQANPVCKILEYRSALLSALPLLSNLDGERSPHSSTYMLLSAEVEGQQLRPRTPWTPLLPEVPNWLANTSLELGGVSEAELLGGREVTLGQELQECSSMTSMLKQRLLEARKAVLG